MADYPTDRWIDELEFALGQAAALRLLANAGGQRRAIPKRAVGSRLELELGPEISAWLSARFGGTELDIPSLRGRQVQDRAAELRAAILEAGLTEPARSANVIAAQYGVTTMWVRKLRAQMRVEYGIEPMLPLFDLDHPSP